MTRPAPSADTGKLKPVAPVLAWQQQLHPDPLSIFSILNRTHKVFGKIFFHFRYDICICLVERCEPRMPLTAEMVYRDHQGNLLLKYCADPG